MHSTDTKSKFIELRAQDWSLARISKQIDVSVRTLADWNQQHRDEIRTLRAIEIEALQEKFLATREQQLSTLTELLKSIDEEIGCRHVERLSTVDLFRLGVATRAEIRKIVINTDTEPETKSDAQK
jgi:hypothetical protein